MLNKEVFEKFGTENWGYRRELMLPFTKICREVRSFKPI